MERFEFSFAGAAKTYKLTRVFIQISGCGKLTRSSSWLYVLRNTENSLPNSLTMKVSLVLVCPVNKCVWKKVLCITATA